MGKWLNLLKEHQGDPENSKTPNYPTDKTDESTPNPTFGSFGSALDGRFQKKSSQEPPQLKVIHPGLEQWQALYSQPEKTAPATEDDQTPTKAVVAEAHSRPAWIKARDDWHRHYFACKVCQRHHRQQTRRPFAPSPCETGRELQAIYEANC